MLKLNELTFRIVSIICLDPQLYIFRLLFESSTAILSLYKLKSTCFTGRSTLTMSIGNGLDNITLYIMLFSKTTHIHSNSDMPPIVVANLMSASKFQSCLKTPPYVWQTSDLLLYQTKFVDSTMNPCVLLLFMFILQNGFAVNSLFSFIIKDYIIILSLNNTPNLSLYIDRLIT